MDHTADNNHNEDSGSIWETYIGKGGSSAFVFIYLIVIFFCIFSFIHWG